MSSLWKVLGCALAVTAAMAISSTAARAEPDPAAASDLIGAWAADCAAAASGGALPVTFFRAPGDPRLWLLTFGINGGQVEPALTQVVVEHALPRHRAAVRFIHADGAAMMTILEFADSNTYSVVESIRPDGVALTKDGIVLRSGRSAIVYHRCSKRAD